MSTRYEILPFGTAEAEAQAAPHPLTLTVTCSPRQGLDHTIAVGERLAALGHAVVVHLAARSIRDAGHLDASLVRLAAAGIEEAFVVGGDGAEPVGAYASAVELLAVLADHPLRPRRIGIGAYPEGHPLIAGPALEAALRVKAEAADYMTTQLCFDPEALLRWLEVTRAAGIALPVHIGLPGAVDRRRLLEVSMRVGVGASISFVRKQRRIRQLLGRPEHQADRLHAAFAPLVGEGGLGITGLHFYTFNRLLATLAWEAESRAAWSLDHREVRDA